MQFGGAYPRLPILHLLRALLSLSAVASVWKLSMRDNRVLVSVTLITPRVPGNLVRFLRRFTARAPPDVQAKLKSRLRRLTREYEELMSGEDS